MVIKEYTTKKISDYLKYDKPKKVCLVFIHGLGDVVMFIEPLKKLIELYPDTEILLGCQKGVGQTEFFGQYVKTVDIMDANKDYEDCEFTFQIHFPMAESFEGEYTKAELCCELELGIEKIWQHPDFSNGLTTICDNKKPFYNPFVAVHFQATAMNEQCNPSEEIAKKIWNEIIEAGFIPIESFYSHVFANPRNVKHPFVSRHVRDLKPDIQQLCLMLGHCFASIGVSSGNFHMSMATMNHKRIMYLKKEYDVSCYTRDKNTLQIDVNNYDNGLIYDWLIGLKGILL